MAKRTYFDVLERPRLRLPVDPQTVGALHLRRDTFLYSVLVGDKTELERPLASERLPVVIGSPLNVHSWGRLVRVGFTLMPAPGHIHAVNEILLRLGLMERHVEASDGFEVLLGKEPQPLLSSTSIVLEVPNDVDAEVLASSWRDSGAATDEEPSHGEESEASERLPDFDCLLGRNAPKKLIVKARELRRMLRDLCRLECLGLSPNLLREARAKTANYFQETLEMCVGEGLGGTGVLESKSIRLDHLSTLRTLNGLHFHLDAAEEARIHAFEKGAESAKERWVFSELTRQRNANGSPDGNYARKMVWESKSLKKLLESENNAKVLTVEVDPNRFALVPDSGSVRRWRKVEFLPGKPGARRIGELCFDKYRRLLDPHQRETITLGYHEGAKDLGVVVTVDTDEHSLISRLVPLDRQIVVELTIVTPGRGLDHHWQTWVFDEIAQAGGQVLGVNTSHRSSARWVHTNLIVAFTFAELAKKGPEHEDQPAEAHVSGTTRPRVEVEIKWELIEKAVTCLRSLRGLRVVEGQSDHSPRFEYALNRIKAYRKVTSLGCLRPVAAFDAADKALRRDTALESVVVHHSADPEALRALRADRDPSPFSPGRAIGAREYADQFVSPRMAEDEDEGSGRKFLPERWLRARELATGIAENLNSSVLLSGAGRVGKSTQLNLIARHLGARHIVSFNVDGSSPFAQLERLLPSRSTRGDSVQAELRKAVENEDSDGAMRLLTAHLSEQDDEEVIAVASLEDEDPIGIQSAEEWIQFVRETAKAGVRWIFCCSAHSLAQVRLGVLVEDSEQRIFVQEGIGSLEKGGSLDEWLNEFLEEPGESRLCVVGNLGLDSSEAVDEVKRRISRPGVERFQMGMSRVWTLISRLRKWSSSASEVGDVIAIAEGDNASLVGEVQELLRRLPDTKDVEMVVLVDSDPERKRMALDPDEQDAWRLLVLHSGDKGIRWVFAVEPDVLEVLGIGAIRSALVPHMMGPLSEAEARVLVSRFERELLRDTEAGGPTVVTPCVTFNAQQLLLDASGRTPYLLQELCHLIYERIVLREIPIVNAIRVHEVIQEYAFSALDKYLSGCWADLIPFAQSDLLNVLMGQASDLLDPQGSGASYVNDELDQRTIHELARVGLAAVPGEFRPAAISSLFLEWVRLHRNELSQSATDSSPSVEQEQ